MAELKLFGQLLLTVSSLTVNWLNGGVSSHDNGKVRMEEYVWLYSDIQNFTIAFKLYRTFQQSNTKSELLLNRNYKRLTIECW